MNRLEKYCFWVVLFFVVIGFSHCKKNDTNYSLIPNSGFVEYQYLDTLVSPKGDTGITKAFNVYPLTQAFFAIDTAITLADSLNTTFRPIALYLYSSGCVFGKTNQPISSSFVRISLIDSIKKTNYPSDGLTPYNYILSNYNTFNASRTKVPIWLAIQGGINLLRDTIYTSAFNGVNTGLNTTINVLYIGNGSYQIVTHGTFNGLSYNVYYTGSIIRQH